MRGTWGWISAAIGCGVLALAAPASAAGEFSVGAARTDVTPPLFDPTHDVTDLGAAAAACPPQVWSGRRVFDFQEPYQDTNNNGQYDYPEPYCDLNGNGRWDGIWVSGAPGTPAQTVRADNRPSARAIAISDGGRTIVIVSVSAEGLFENYVAKIRAAVHAARNDIQPGDVIVSADHNESTPDTVGINGGPDVGIGAGVRSGIDDYYMNGFLVPQVAKAATEAAASMRPATLWARNFRLPSNLNVHLSNNWPTTDGIPNKEADTQPAAIDPKVRVLQARDSAGKPIVTMMNLAAHNQEIGHSADKPTKATLAADWPGFFERKLEATLGGGMGMYMVGANGSEEDPHTVPKLPASTGPGCPDGCFAQAQATGEAFAAAVAAELPRAQRLRFGPVQVRSHQFCVPLENNLFRAAVAAGLFAERQSYACSGDQMVPTGSSGNQLKTEVGVATVGPDLQFIANPGEAFPALMLGSPFGVEDTPCSGADTADRTNPAIPTWRATAAYRFQAGLANDMIGYELPGWAFVAPQGSFDTTCDSGSGSVDSKGHQHKLETEGVGPTASNQVANELSKLLGIDSLAQIRVGRFVHPNGSLSRRAEGAVAVWLADGTVLALPGVTGFGSRAIDASARMMDYDGGEQPGDGDVTTRGMVEYGCDGKVLRRVYLDLFPALAAGAPSKLGPAARGEVQVGCGSGFGSGGQGNGPAGAGGGPPQPVAAGSSGCTDLRAPRARFDRRRGARVSRSRRLSLRGRATDRGCAGLGAVLVSVSRPHGHRCRFVQANGRLTRPRGCRRPVLLRASGTGTWRLSLKTPLAPGRYRAQVRAVDRHGNKETPGRANVVRVRVR